MYLLCQDQPHFLRHHGGLLTSPSFYHTEQALLRLHEIPAHILEEKPTMNDEGLIEQQYTSILVNLKYAGITKKLSSSHRHYTTRETCLISYYFKILKLRITMPYTLAAAHMFIFLSNFILSCKLYFCYFTQPVLIFFFLLAFIDFYDLSLYYAVLFFL